MLFYAALAASLLLSLVGLLAALREPALRFRLLWAVLALVGVGGGAGHAGLGCADGDQAGAGLDPRVERRRHET